MYLGRELERSGRGELGDVSIYHLYCNILQIYLGSSGTFRKLKGLVHLNHKPPSFSLIPVDI